MNVAAPPLDELDADDPDTADDTPPPPTPRRPRHRRRLLSRLALPTGTVELGLFAVVAFVLWWTTRSWVLTALLAVAWLTLVAAARTLHRARRSTTAQRRVTRERLTAFGVTVFVLFGCATGIRAWSTKAPHVPKADPPNAYLAVGGAATSAWQAMYGRPATVRAVTQTAPYYWVVVVEDEEGCWSQSVVLRSAPQIAGERTLTPCPLPAYLPTSHGDPIDLAKSAAAQAAVDFTRAWYSGTNWSIYTAPGSTIHPLDRRVDVDKLTVYPIADAANAATVWVVADLADGPVGLQVGLVDDKGRWFVSGIAASPPVDGSVTEPLPDRTTSTSSPSTTTTSTAR